MQVLDPAHGAKNGSLQPLSMARMLLLGNWPVLAMQLLSWWSFSACTGVGYVQPTSRGPCRAAKFDI